MIIKSVKQSQVNGLKKYTAFVFAIYLLFCFAECDAEKNKFQDTSQTSGRHSESNSAGGENSVQKNAEYSKPYTVNTRISDVISDPAFEDYGRLILLMTMHITANIQKTILLPLCASEKMTVLQVGKLWKTEQTL